MLVSLLSVIVIFRSAAISDLDSAEKSFSFEDDTALSLDPTLPSVANPPAPLSFDQSSFIPLDDLNTPTLLNSDQISGDLMSTINDNDMDISDASLWDDLDGGIAGSMKIDNGNEPNFFEDDDDDDLFQLVDCSNSESLPAFDTPIAFDTSSTFDTPLAFDTQTTFDTLDTLPDFDNTNNRLRRRDGPGGECTNPVNKPRPGSRSSPRTSPSGSNLEDQFRELLKTPEMMERATTAGNQNPNYNTPCFVITDGRLPWGVCSSGQVTDQQRLAETFLFAAARGLAQWRLSGAILGTLDSSINLVNSSWLFFFCT